ncbi:hypothetical protein [Sphingobium baderi]|uniref:hypothetical protein n=1 Tax=Sphingobium baderi TaxID=1332080 RepID=UPI002B4047F4|nr:hypothetical protein [Sphingobium baderi]WRD78828.1 hypothetical protein QQ987_19315 [Sphingobium baderi]
MHFIAMSSGDFAWLCLEAASFVATTLLLSWGCFVLLFLALGGFSLEGVMHQLANFSTRYVAADAERLSAFRHLLLVGHIAVSLTILVLRRARIVALVRAGRRCAHV